MTVRRDCEESTWRTVSSGSERSVQQILLPSLYNSLKSDENRNTCDVIRRMSDFQMDPSQRRLRQKGIRNTAELPRTLAVSPLGLMILL